MVRAATRYEIPVAFDVARASQAKELDRRETPALQGLQRGLGAEAAGPVRPVDASRGKRRTTPYPAAFRRQCLPEGRSAGPETGVERRMAFLGADRGAKVRRQRSTALGARNAAGPLDARSAATYVERGRRSSSSLPGSDDALESAGYRAKDPAGDRNRTGDTLQQDLPVETAHTY